MIDRSALRLRNPYDRDIARLAVPALGGLVAEPLYILADTAIVGRLGTTALAGLAVASTVLLTLTSVLIFLAYGTTGIVGRLIGAGDERGAASQSIQSLWLAVMLGAAIALAIGLSAGWLIGLFGVDAATEAAAQLYLRISLWGTPGMLMVLAGTGVFNGRQNTVTPLVVAVVGAVVNLVVEVVAIWVFDFGLGASAGATVVAQWLTAVLFVVPIVRWARSQGVGLMPRPAQMTALLGAGAALIVRTLALRAAFTLSVGIAARMGSADVAGHQVALGVWSTLALALDAVAIAGQALTAKLIGAGDRVVAKLAADRMVVIDVAIGIAMAVGLTLIREPLAQLFSDDATVVAAAALCLGWIAPQLPINGLVFALDGILIGARDLVYLAWSMVVAFAVFAIGAATVLAFDGGLGALWLALGVFMAARGALMWGRYNTGRWLRTTS